MAVLGDNVFILGNKSNTGADNTIKGKLKRIAEWVDQPTKCYPTAAVGVNVASGSGTAWTLTSSAVEIMPANTAVGNFQLFDIIIEDVDSSGFDLIVILYAGATEIGSIRRFNDSNDGQIWNVQVDSAVFARTQAISAKSANSSTSTRTPIVSILYREVG